MSRHREFVEFVIEQMALTSGLRVRAMFGGYGVYRDGYIFAIIVDDRLYFKTDNVSRGEFEAKGLSPLTYTARGKQVTMQYFEASPEVFEDVKIMDIWVKKAYEAARSSHKSKSKSKTRKTRAAH